MRQRAAIAMALACKPKVLLADEPTTALDVMVQAQILELLVSLSDDLGLALVLVTHDLPVVAQTCTPSGRHVRGRDRRDGLRRAALPRPPPSLHASAVRGDARSLRRGRRRLDSRRAAAPRPASSSAARSPALRPCLRAVPDGPARASSSSATATSRSLSPERPGRTGGLVTGERHRQHCSGAAARGRRSRHALPGPAWNRRARSRAARSEAVHAVEGVSFTLAEGEMLALVGESGCGKTTTAQTVMRLIEPDAGTIRFRGRDITALSARRAAPAAAPHADHLPGPYESLDPRFRVRQTVEEPLVVHGVGTREERARAGRRGARARRTDPARALPRPLPARALGRPAPARRDRGRASSLEPELLVADEPVSMLDVSVRAGILALLDEPAELGPRDPHDHARPLDRRALRRPDRGHVPRADRRGGARARGRRAIRGIRTRRRSSRSCRSATRATARDPQILPGETPNPMHVPPGCRFHPRCPAVFERCPKEDPVELLDAGRNGHRAACWLLAR